MGPRRRITPNVGNTDAGGTKTAVERMAYASMRFNQLFTAITSRGPGWKFEHARPYADGADSAADKFIFGDIGIGAFERALTIYARALDPRTNQDRPRAV